MWNLKQNKLTSKTETDSESRLTALGKVGGGGAWRDTAKKEKKRKLINRDNSVVIVGSRWGGRGKGIGG